MLQLTAAGLLAIAIQLAAPILVALLFTMAAMGLIARTVPNMNAFIMSFPASFLVGLVVYIATLPFFPNWMTDHFGSVHEQICTAPSAALAGGRLTHGGRTSRGRRPHRRSHTRATRGILATAARSSSRAS